jgi:glycosyltransferase involved in cell wall biosynthesis
VAPRRGGVLDTVIPDETGVLVDEMNEESIAAGLRKAARRSWDVQRIRTHAERFSRERFIREIETVIEQAMAAPPGQRC